MECACWDLAGTVVPDAPNTQTRVRAEWNPATSFPLEKLCCLRLHCFRPRPHCNISVANPCGAPTKPCMELESVLGLVGFPMDHFRLSVLSQSTKSLSKISLLIDFKNI